MEQHLVEYSQTYFWQVHGTLYTIPPLSQLLQYNALMDFGEAIHEGTTQIDELEIEDVMKLFLKHQHCKMTPTEKSEHLLEFKRLMQGYHKWPECTSTSPSGQHLGIYKSLLKDFPPEPSSDYKPWTYGMDIMGLLFQMLEIAVKHTHIYPWWKVIWNMYLEKDPGNPHIDRLRALHLIKADLNLLFKWYSSLGFMENSEKAQWLNDSQYGGCLGCSTIDLACKKMYFTISSKSHAVWLWTWAMM